MKPETESERAARHAATVAAYRALVDPAAPPRRPYLLEHHFFSTDAGDVTGLTRTLEEQKYQIDAFAYNPDDSERTWVVSAIKLDYLEEERLLALSDEMDALARQYDCTYDGWLTRVE